MNVIANLIWHFPFFGFIDALLAYLVGFLLTLTVVGAPIGMGLMQYGKFLLAPFGRRMVKEEGVASGKVGVWSIYSTLVSIVYLPFGFLLVCLALFKIVLLTVSVVGIPVAIVLAKSLGTLLNPVNKKCVSATSALRAGEGGVAGHGGLR